MNIHNAFHQAQYNKVVEFDTSSLSETNAIPARVLQLRARIALGEQDQVISEVEKEDDTPDFAAVKAFAEHTKDPEDESSKQKAVELSKSDSNNLTVQLLCGTILSNVGMKDEALALLAKHEGSLDAYVVSIRATSTPLTGFRVALITQIHLSQNRLDLAQQEVKRAKGWAQDNLLVNLAESWVGLREVRGTTFGLVKKLIDMIQGGEKYQAAFYVYEELATAPSTSSPHNVLGQSIAELHLGRLPESEAALAQALQISPDDPDLIANAIVLNTILGKDEETATLRKKLEQVNPHHQLVTDLEKKRELFESARSKYQPVLDIPSEA